MVSSDEESSDDYDFNQQAKKKTRPADKKTVRVFDAIFACRDWCSIAKRPVPAPHLAHPEGCAALRIVLVAEPRVSRSCELFRMDSIFTSYKVCLICTSASREPAFGPSKYQ